LGSEQTWVIAPDMAATSDVRRHVTDACAGLSPDTVDAARLLATELFSNAVRHGAGDIVLVVGREVDALRVEIQDESLDLPVPAAPSPAAEGGMGLRLVSALASDWGVDTRSDGQPGKRVWFSIL
jgi:two-component sensor histidine kinase